jgi:hypothetical protein
VAAAVAEPARQVWPVSSISTPRHEGIFISPGDDRLQQRRQLVVGREHTSTKLGTP